MSIQQVRPFGLGGFGVSSSLSSILNNFERYSQKYDRFQGVFSKGKKNGKQRVFEDLESAMLKGGP